MGLSRTQSRVLTAACLLVAIAALDDGLARTPPMGWRSWEAFYGRVDERVMLATMDVLSDRSRYVNKETGERCQPSSGGHDPVCVKMSLADLGFSQIVVFQNWRDESASVFFAEILNVFMFSGKFSRL